MSEERDSGPRKWTRREVTGLIGGGLLGSALPSGAAQANEPPVPVQPRVIPAEDLLAASIGEMARALRTGAVTSSELTHAYLQRIEAVNPGLNAIVHAAAAEAMEAARRADEALRSSGPLGPLHGIPMTLKDSIDTAGMVTTWGTLGRGNFVPEQDATVTARLRAAGAVLLGKTNTPEFTLSFETTNLVYGQTRNPHDRSRSPGGSSGGAGAAVSSALCAFDIGSDTGGSIRVPSNFCGTAGLKPTQGRVPRTGHAVAYGGIHDGLTQLGPIARTVDDLELLLRIIAGPDGHDPFVVAGPLGDSADVDLAALRIGWHADNGYYSPTEDIQNVVRESVRALGQAGTALGEAMPPLPASFEEFLGLFAWNSDGGAWIQRLLDEAGTSKPHPLIGVQINPEYKVDSGELTRRMEQRDRFRSAMLAFMQGYDALITPVTAFTAPPAGETDSEELMPGYSYTMVYNLAGLPAVVVRCGTSAAGLPIGVQIAARPWQEHVALAVARRLEQEFGGWRMPAPRGVQT